MANPNTAGAKAARAASSKTTKERNKGKGWEYFSVGINAEAAAVLSTETAATGESKSAVINRALLELGKNNRK